MLWRISTSLMLVAAAAWIWFGKAPSGGASDAGLQLPREGFLAPDFSLETLAGSKITLSELRGQPVLINLWASWCQPCRAEMPAMQKIYEDLSAQGFEILAINATNQDNLLAVTAFVQEHGLTFPILLDADGRVSSLYQLKALPTSFFINSRGEIQEVVIGGPMSEALLRIRVEQLLEAKP